MTCFFRGLIFNSCNLLAVAIVATSLIAGVHANQQTLWPSPDWLSAEPAEMGLDLAKLNEAKRFSQSAGGSGMIVLHGKVVMRWGDQEKRYDIKSATKSFGATMLGVAIKDGKMAFDDLAVKYHPTLGVPPQSNANTGWLDDITILHLATQTAGFEKPGGYEKLLFQPGTQWHYSDGGPNWLAECLTLLYRRDLQDLMFERVFTPLGITRSDLQWRNNAYRDHKMDGIPRREFGSGIHANVEALSRLGYLYLHKGRWKDEQILSKDFAKMASRPIPSVVGLPEWSSSLGDVAHGDVAHGNVADHYGLLWWNNADGTLEDLPHDAFWAWGLFDSLVVVVPSLDLVVVRGGERGKSFPLIEGQGDYQRLDPFLSPIVAAVQVQRKQRASQDPTAEKRNPPYPPSTVITQIEWAPKESIIRMAKGGDNWPTTWADDDHLYSAYGDGRGFKPVVEKKLSLGLVRVEGSPPSIRGINLRSDGVEQIGQDKHGKKASGMLMVDGVLYMLARNAGNAQLAWSNDHGQTWTWADWKWTTSFGCPTFLNFGKNYEGARDDYVYVYSLDGNSAYQPKDQMVMARVPRNNIRLRSVYEFFAGNTSDGNPTWTKNIRDRAAVFVHSGRCYRSGVSYNAGIKRYLWCQVLPESNDPRGQRFQGGFGIYDAPEPWGPWTTVFFNEDWDVGPGETSSFPTKWMSHDGKSIHLVFSGDDFFSVRRATLTTK